MVKHIAACLVQPKEIVQLYESGGSSLIKYRFKQVFTVTRLIYKNKFGIPSRYC